MTDLTLTHEATPQTTPKSAAVPTGEYPLSTLCLRLDLEGVGLSWTLRGDDSDVASRLPRVLEYIKRMQATLPKAAAPPPAGPPALQAAPPSQGPVLEPHPGTGPAPREIHDCAWHGPMRESTKAPGTWFCPKKTAAGTYCPAKWPQRA